MALIVEYYYPSIDKDNQKKTIKITNNNIKKMLNDHNMIDFMCDSLKIDIMRKISKKELSKEQKDEIKTFFDNLDRLKYTFNSLLRFIVFENNEIIRDNGSFDSKEERVAMEELIRYKRAIEFGIYEDDVVVESFLEYSEELCSKYRKIANNLI